MSKTNEKILNIEDYLINEDLPICVFYLLKDYLVNETITKEEINKIMTLPKDEFIKFINNYTLKGE